MFCSNNAGKLSCMLSHHTRVPINYEMAWNANNVCHICDKVCKSSGRLKNTNIHKNKPNDNKMPHVCQLCARFLKSLSSLKNHICSRNNQVLQYLVMAATLMLSMTIFLYERDIWYWIFEILLIFQLKWIFFIIHD